MDFMTSKRNPTNMTQRAEQPFYLAEAFGYPHPDAEGTCTYSGMVVLSPIDTTERDVSFSQFKPQF